jgi:hypothetical protein
MLNKQLKLTGCFITAEAIDYGLLITKKASIMLAFEG